MFRRNLEKITSNLMNSLERAKRSRYFHAEWIRINIFFLLFLSFSLLRHKNTRAAMHSVCVLRNKRRRIDKRYFHMGTTWNKCLFAHSYDFLIWNALCRVLCGTFTQADNTHRRRDNRFIASSDWILKCASPFLLFIICCYVVHGKIWLGIGHCFQNMGPNFVWDHT